MWSGFNHLTGMYLNYSDLELRTGVHVCVCMCVYACIGVSVYVCIFLCFVCVCVREKVRVSWPVVDCDHPGVMF